MRAAEGSGRLMGPLRPCVTLVPAVSDNDHLDGIESLVKSRCGVSHRMIADGTHQLDFAMQTKYCPEWRTHSRLSFCRPSRPNNVEHFQQEIEVCRTTYLNRHCLGLVAKKTLQ